MEQIDGSTVLTLPEYKVSRRSLYCAGVGAVALSMGLNRSVNSAPDPHTEYGAVACSSPPSTEGMADLSALYDSTTESVTQSPQDRERLAESLGFTIVPAEALNDFIVHELSGAKSSFEAVRIASEFAEQWLGVSISLGSVITEPDSTAIAGEPNVMIQHLSKFLEYATLLPAEFYQSARILNLSLEDLPSGQGGRYSYENGIVRVDLSQIRFASVLFHELSHAVQLVGCNAFPDQAMVDSLPEGVDYTDEYAYDEELDDVFAIPYGQTNYMEDFATVAMGWMTGQLGLSEDLEGTPLYDKVAIVMDRFEWFLPGSLRYIQEGVRPVFKSRA